MTILQSYKLTVAAVLVFSGSVAFAQSGAVDPKISGSSAGVNKDWLPSRTADGAYDRVPMKDRFRQPIPWQYIRESDILWKKRIWREIDTREKQNVGFRYSGDEHSAGGMFIEILIDAIKKGKIVAYGTADDRFTTILTKEQLMEQVAGKVDTETVIDPIDGTEVLRTRITDFKPETITKFRIKEDWIFDRNQGQMVVRIVGLAPVQDKYGDDGIYRGSAAMFWLYYPDIRGLLANHEVFNPQNDMFRRTWDEFFETRMFASRITKVSNPFGSIVGANGESFQDHLSPMESLYEGKRTAEEIFNKEHDMWEY
ncbi:MAG: gliding motility protein GldN [Taibaiella sp.]|jgi:gliding motility associated protien GldN|nr:gliding motility protein GldN [Taibaiella sp.]